MRLMGRLRLVTVPHEGLGVWFGAERPPFAAPVPVPHEGLGDVSPATCCIVRVGHRSPYEGLGAGAC